jgi:hypothetical protein
MIKNREEVEKELEIEIFTLLDEISCYGIDDSWENRTPLEKERIIEPLKYKTSQIRKDDRIDTLDELVEWIGVKNKTYCQEDIFLRKSKPYDWHGYTHALHDIIAYLQILKEKV